MKMLTEVEGVDATSPSGPRVMPARRQLLQLPSSPPGNLLNRHRRTSAKPSQMQTATLLHVYGELFKLLLGPLSSFLCRICFTSLCLYDFKSSPTPSLL